MPTTTLTQNSKSSFSPAFFVRKYCYDLIRLRCFCEQISKNSNLTNFKCSKVSTNCFSFTTIRVNHLNLFVQFIQFQILLLQIRNRIKKLILYKSSKRVSWSNGWGVELEVAHVVRKAIVTPEPNGAQTGVKCRRSLLGSYVNTWVNVLRYCETFGTTRRFPNILRCPKR